MASGIISKYRKFYGEDEIMPSAKELFEGKKQEIIPKIIYRNKEIIKIPFDEKEFGYIEKALATYISSYRGNLKKNRTKGKPVKLAGNYLDILYMIQLYGKITNTEYYEKELFDLLDIEKGVNIQKLIEERRTQIYE